MLWALWTIVFVLVIGFYFVWEELALLRKGLCDLNMQAINNLSNESRAVRADLEKIQKLLKPKW